MQIAGKNYYYFFLLINCSIVWCAFWLLASKDKHEKTIVGMSGFSLVFCQALILLPWQFNQMIIHNMGFLHPEAWFQYCLALLPVYFSSEIDCYSNVTAATFLALQITFFVVTVVGHITSNTNNEFCAIFYTFELHNYSLKNRDCDSTPPRS